MKIFDFFIEIPIVYDYYKKSMKVIKKTQILMIDIIIKYINDLIKKISQQTI